MWQPLYLAARGDCGLLEQLCKPAYADRNPGMVSCSSLKVGTVLRQFRVLDCQQMQNSAKTAKVAHPVQAVEGEDAQHGISC